MKHFKIMGRIVLLFSIIMFMSFIPDSFPEFFGDWYCDGGNYYKQEGCLYGPAAIHGPTVHWGFRHYIWVFMGITLFIYNAVIMVIKLDKESR
jgi:hypothetical protein